MDHALALFLSIYLSIYLDRSISSAVSFKRSLSQVLFIFCCCLSENVILIAYLQKWNKTQKHTYHWRFAIHNSQTHTVFHTSNVHRWFVGILSEFNILCMKMVASCAFLRFIKCWNYEWNCHWKCMSCFVCEECVSVWWWWRLVARHALHALIALLCRSHWPFLFMVKIKFAFSMIHFMSFYHRYDIYHPHFISIFRFLWLSSWFLIWK